MHQAVPLTGNVAGEQIDAMHARVLSKRSRQFHDVFDLASGVCVTPKFHLVAAH